MAPTVSRRASSLRLTKVFGAPDTEHSTATVKATPNAIESEIDFQSEIEKLQSTIDEMKIKHQETENSLNQEISDLKIKVTALEKPLASGDATIAADIEILKTRLTEIELNGVKKPTTRKPKKEVITLKI